MSYMLFHLLYGVECYERERAMNESFLLAIVSGFSNLVKNKLVLYWIISCRRNKPRNSRRNFDEQTM